jgi:hypothetical protein
MRLPGIVVLAFLIFSAPIAQPFFGPSTAEARPPGTTCRTDSYVNSRGHCVRRPVQADRVPTGATAKCRDGTYSFSQSRRGTCSWHGGVATWL